VQFGPDARAGTERQQANGLPAAAQRQHEEPGAPTLMGLGIAHHRAGAVSDLRFLAGGGDDYHAGFGRLRAAQLAHEALHALVAVDEAVFIDQVLPDRSRIAASAEPQFDGLPIWLAGTGAGTALRRSNWFRRKSTHFVSLEAVEVGDHLRVGNHLVGRFSGDYHWPVLGDR